MKFEPNKVYCHPGLLDTVIYVTRVIDESDKGIFMEVNWFNNRGLNLDVQENIFVKAKDLGEWYEVTQDDFKYL
jgi:hypothetical protein